MSNYPFDIFSMKQKVVVITGGAGFLGMQYANSLSSAGARIVIFDQCDQALLDKAVKQIQKKSKKRTLGVRVDITDEKAVKQATQEVVKHFGRIDVLINNAGMNPMVGSDEAQKMFAPYESYPAELWRKEIEVDLTGAHNCAQAVARVMKRQRSGVIINIASEVASIAVDNRIYGKGKYKSIAYITAKSGILGLTRAWAAYLGEYGIRVNAFSPGGMPRAEVPPAFRKKYSSLNMLGRMADVGEYDAAILFLCSDASSFMTGTNMVMDAGKSAW
jgi:NAD(P)-dependent dehydrogenase (short-subunit alcohol dehydrogenase family)